MKKKYSYPQIKEFKISSKYLCEGSNPLKPGEVDPNDPSPGTESKSSYGINWDFYENWDDNK